MADCVLPVENINILFRFLQVKLEFFYFRQDLTAYHVGVKVVGCEAN